MLEEAFREELEELMSLNQGVDLNAVLAKLVKKAEDCANKVQDETAGPPSYLTNELETLYCEMRIYIKRKEKVAGRVIEEESLKLSAMFYC